MVFAETEQEPVELLGMEAFQRVANQGMEGMQRQTATLWQGPGCAPRNTHNTIF